MRYNIVQSPEFEKWLSSQSPKTQLIVTARLERLGSEQHWGHINKFDGLIELKWKSGIRVYSAIIYTNTVVMLLGGNKNGQSKDIKKAKKILRESLQKIRAQ